MNIDLFRTNFLEAVLASFLLLTHTGCAETPSREILEEVSSSQREFLLGPEDILDIVVWRNQDLSQKEVVVRPDGKITMPLIGEVMASGQTANQLATQISERLKQFKESPSVSVSVKEVNSYNVYVLGSVMKPGKYQLKVPTTVLQAITIAGGFNNYAFKNRMQVVRNRLNSDGTQTEMRIPVRYDDLVFGEGEQKNFLLKTGDVVVVP